MSAYSDWKCGALSDEEYDRASKNEARLDRIAALREEAAFIDQYRYGRSMDMEYYYDPREEG